MCKNTCAHTQRAERLSPVADYGLLGIGGLLLMKSGCQDTARTEAFVDDPFCSSMYSHLPSDALVNVCHVRFLSVPYEVGRFVSLYRQTLLSSTVRHWYSVPSVPPAYLLLWLHVRLHFFYSLLLPAHRAPVAKTEKQNDE